MSGEPLRIVFLGTPDFAVPTLQALLASRHRVVAVITQPDRPRGRGQKVVDGPVKACARAARLPVLQPSRLKAPAPILPGTRMPAFWPDYPKSFYPQMEGSAENQIRAIRDHLLTLRGGPSPRRPSGAQLTN